MSPAGTTVTDRIAADLRRGISDGTLAPGAALPTEHALVSQYGAARGTVRQALSRLASEGLIISRTGRGHFVREQREYRWQAIDPAGRDATEDIWRSWVAKTLERAGDAQIDVSIANPPPAHVAAAMDIDQAVARRRVRTVDGEPWMLSIGYYPLAIADGTPLAQAHDLQPGVIATLRDLGHEPVSHVDEIRGRMPTAVETALIGLDHGTPVLERTRLSRDSNGDVVRATVDIFPADRFVVTYDLNQAGI